MTEIISALEEQSTILQRIESHLQLEKPIWDIHDLCNFTRLSKSHIYSLTFKGLIPHYKQSKHLFFDKDEIIDWLKENRGFNQKETDREAKSAIKMKGGMS